VCTKEAIAAWIRGLESLRDGPGAAAALAACGPPAVPALREYLRSGQPASIFQPRQWAVRALAEVGAWPELLDYLEHPRTIPDAVVRQGEDAVRSTAAEELARFPCDAVYRGLTRMAAGSGLPGVARALGRLGRAEAATLLIPMLDDDVCRPAAEEALRRLGEPVRPALLAAAGEPPAPGAPPGERVRRRALLRLLADYSLNARDWAVLRPLAAAHDAEIALRAAALGLSAAPPEERPALAAALLRLLPRVDGFLQAEACAALAGGYGWAAAAVDEEIARRRAALERTRRPDTLLPMLEALRARALRPTEGL
jgi:hypothetical protein